MPILAQSYQGIPGGMNQNVPAHEIPDTQASYMQDIILNTPGIIKRRGPLTKYSGSASLNLRATGIVSTQDPNGSYVVAVLAGSAIIAYLNVYSSDLSSATPLGFQGGFTFDPSVPRYLVDSKPMLGGGTLIGFANSLLASTTSSASLAIWKGGDNQVNATGVTATIGSTAVSAATSMFTDVVPGMFLVTHTTGYYIGTVKSVTDNKNIVLQQKALRSVSAGAVDALSMIGVNPRAMKGRISIVPASTTVRGTQGPQGTKFISQGLDSGTWNLYRLADDTWIGAVSSVLDNATLTLDTNELGTAGMTNERYYAVKDVSVTGTDLIGGISGTVGWLNTVWNGRQWYANRPLNSQSNDLSTRLWFSDEADPQGLDLSPDDGDFINIPSSSTTNTPIVAIQGIPSGLLIFKETETFILTGNDYTDFAVQKIADTGCLSTASVMPAANGCIWAGRDGILYFDGKKIQPLSAGLGDFWTQSIKGFNTSTDRMGAVIWKNHYLLYIDNFASTYTIRKAAATTTPSKMTLAINLDTFAVTTFTNVAIKGGMHMPAGSGFPSLFVVDDGGSPGHTYIIDASKLLDATGTGSDGVTCGGASAGPDFYLETKKYNMGDPERKKLFKQIAMTFVLTGDSMAMDTVPGLNTTGTAINTQWLTQSAFANLRKKFTKRDTHMQFRFYQNSSSVTDVKIGPISIGFKLQRVGRV